ncbi:TRAP transporter small permease [Tropicimonas marinistellae]|uniref:TRAP transporter small permease n=1 Tax=Tropicimonas marinistellae TaxID=1739787 RepID=UPI00083079DD|nr:TRAP transporter small permease subunit [Tropicimonas marinistellae]
MEKITRSVRNVFAFGAGCSMALVFAIIFVNSVRRYTIGKSIAWGEELPIYLTIYGVMFGIAYAYMTDCHIRFSVVSDLLPERMRGWLWIASDVVTVVCGLALVVAGHAFALRRGGVDSSGLKATADWLADTSGVTALEWIGKAGTWQYAIAIGGLMLSIAALLRLVERLGAAPAEGVQ